MAADSIMHEQNVPPCVSCVYCSVNEVESIIGKWKKNKAASRDGITAEHLMHGHPYVVLILTKLINLILRFKHVPGAFGLSITFPVPKYPSTKTRSLINNYRGITVSPVISKILEHCFI